MTWFHAINGLYAVSGFAVGLLVGVTGVGGGSSMTPLLVLVFGFHPSTAVGTDLLSAGLPESGGTLVHGLNRTVIEAGLGRRSTGARGRARPPRSRHSRRKQRGMTRRAMSRDADR